MNYGVVPALVMTIFSTTAAFAQSPTPFSSDDQPALFALAKSAVLDCGERAQLVVYFEKTADAVVATAKKSQFGLSDTQWEKYREIMRSDLNARVDDYIAVIATDYAAHLSKDDMLAMIAFCQSPAGKKVGQLRAQMEEDSYSARKIFMTSAILGAEQDALQKVQAKEKTF